MTIGSRYFKKLRRRWKKQKKRSKKYAKRHTQGIIILIGALVILGGMLFTIRTIMRGDVVPDDRAMRIDAYYTQKKAPLAGYGAYFVQAADKCEMDWRLLPAIAMQESTGGKRMQLNNPFGWGGAQIPFETLQEAIYEVGAHLCGHRTSTEKWYSTTSTYEKLYYYNGTVRPTYPDEVLWIMEQI